MNTANQTVTIGSLWEMTPELKSDALHLYEVTEELEPGWWRIRLIDGENRDHKIGDESKVETAWFAYRGKLGANVPGAVRRAS